MAHCSWCSAFMPDERLEFYDLCSKCNDEKPNKIFMVYGHKTAGSIQIVKGTNAEGIRQAENAYRRKR